MAARDQMDQINETQGPALAPTLDGGPAAAAGAKKRRQRLVALILLVSGAACLGRWYFAQRHIESTDNAYFHADSVTVAPKVVGYVAEVFVQDNQTVAVGQPLVRLDRRAYRAAQDQAVAAIAARSAEVARAQAELLQQQASIAQARAQLQGARSAASYTAARLERFEPLVAKGGETADKLAELRNASNQASAKVAADLAALDVAEQQRAGTLAQLELARAELLAAQASARQSQIDLDDTVVRSTTAGRIGDRTVRVGQFAQAGTRMMTVVPTQDIYLVANFKETQVGAMSVGQQVSISVDALPGIVLHGMVESFAPGTGSQFALLPPENATGNFTKVVQRIPVRIQLMPGQAERKALVPGMSASVRIDTQERNRQERVHG